MARVSPEQLESFRRDGFVVIPELLRDEELERFGKAVDAAVAARTSGDTRTLAQKSRYEQSFQQCMNLWEDFEDVRPLSFHPRVAEAAAALLGVRALRLWHDQALYKQAGGRATDPHNDQPYWPIEETDTISAWIPFDGSTLLNGAMGYLPGSQLFGYRRFANIFTGTGLDLLDPEVTRGIEPVFAEVPRRAVAFHHGLTIHLAGENRTRETRRVHTMIYFADGSHRRDSRQQHPSVDRPGIAPGALIESELTPIAWPRAEGDLPPPPRDSQALAALLRAQRPA